MIAFGLHRLGGTNLRIGHSGSGAQLKLALPALRDIAKFFESPEFVAFVESIRREPLGEHRLKFSAHNSATTITFEPRATTSIASHPSYRGLDSLRKNPIVNRLNDKDRQLSQSAVRHPSIVVIADNDCEALQQHGGRHEPRVEQVVDVFLNGRPERRHGPLILQTPVSPRAHAITGVLLLVVREGRHPGGRQRRFIEARYVRNRRQPPLPADVMTALDAAVAALPPVQQLPVNAKTSWRFPWHYGGYEIGSGEKMTRFKLSVETIQGLLTGTLPFDQFARHHEHVVQVMRGAVERGQRISSFRVERCPDEDDDWVTIEFAAIDPEEAALVRRRGRLR